MSVQIISFYKITLVYLMLWPLNLAMGQDINKQLQHYSKLNNSEKRLIEYKDSQNNLLLKLKQLQIINQNRKRYGAKPLALDIFACRLANQISKESAENKYVGHWNMAGEKPYHRYAFAGGTDHISENASGVSSSAVLEKSNNAVSLLMQNNHAAFINERKPNDGHKQTVIDKIHNYVGLGYHVSKFNASYYELYIDRYYRFEEIPECIEVGETFILRCSSSDKYHLNLLIAYYENECLPLSPQEISSRPYYNDFSDEIALQILPWEIKQYRSGNNYEFPLKFDKAGLYYIHIYSDKKAYKEGSKYSSDSKLQASGVVFRVKDK